MGSKGSKARKPAHHLPPVGSPENRAYEHQTEKREVFGSWPVWIILGVLALMMVVWLFVLTL